MAKKKDNVLNLGEGELVKKLQAFRDDLREIRFKAEGAKPKNVKEANSIRKNIARILTVMNSTRPNGSVGRE